MNAHTKFIQPKPWSPLSQRAALALRQLPLNIRHHEPQVASSLCIYASSSLLCQLFVSFHQLNTNQFSTPLHTERIISPFIIQHQSHLHFSLLCDIAEKRFHLLLSMLSFRGLFVCPSRSCIVLKRQNIWTQFFLLTTAPCLSQIVLKFGLHRSTPSSEILPKVTHPPQLIWASVFRKIAAE